jgi:hypothetical protein
VGREYDMGLSRELITAVELLDDDRRATLSQYVSHRASRRRCRAMPCSPPTTRCAANPWCRVRARRVRRRGEQRWKVWLLRALLGTSARGVFRGR